MTRNAAGTRRLAQSAVAAGIALALCCGFWTAPALAVRELSSQESRDDISIGTAYMERCMFEEAVAAFSRAVKADPEGALTTKAYDCLGYLYWCRGWKSEAEKAFGESLRRAGDAQSQLRARLALGQVLLELGRIGEACSELNEALKLAAEQDRDIVYTLLGIARFEAGDTTAAAELFSRALEAFAENPVARSYLQRLSLGMQLHLPSAKTVPAVRATGSDKTSGAAVRSGTPAGVGPSTSGGAQALQGVVFVNSGAAYAIAPHVTLTLGMTMSVPARGFFLAAGDNTFRWHDWRTPMIEWRLRGESDGRKPVNVVYYALEPRAAIIAEASIVLDREPPWGSLEINEGKQYTNSTRVTLCLSAGDRTSGILNVSASNDGATWSRWTMYQFTKEWDLLPGDGTKTVYVRFQDKAGNVSTPVSARIVLDTVPPKFIWADVVKIEPTAAEIVWATDEESDSAVEYAAEKEKETSRVRDEDMTMLHHIRLKDLKPSAKYRFRVLSRDRAGNLAVSRELEFITKAPSQAGG